jgi:hypothetical protein
MTNSQRLAKVRSALRQWVAMQVHELAKSNDHATDNASIHPKFGHESLLIRRGFYCGRRFEFHPYHAIWFLEEDQLKIFAADDRLLATMTAQEIDRWSEESSLSKKIDQVGRAA